MFIKNYDEVKEQLYSKLEEYLQDHDINTGTLFSCIHPGHEDRNPSCSIQGNDKRTFLCFSCKSSGNIFTAAHYLEGKPMSGKAFILDNLKYLADKFEIPVEMEEPTEAELYEIDTYNAYRCAAEYILSAKQSKKVREEVSNRGWSKDTLIDTNTGTVENFKTFRQTMKNYGFSAQFLDDIDLGRKDLFNEDALIFCIKDEYDAPVGFASKNLNYNGEKVNGRKYINQKTTGIKCNIYRKGSRLYGLSNVIKKSSKKRKPIYIFEGYSDVITAVDKNLWNCCAIGGLSFTEDHLYLLKENGFHDIILCLDGDTAGKNATVDLLDKIFSMHKDINVKIINMPADQDPDDFIRNRGITAFKKLKQWTTFEWRLAEFDDDDDDETICNAMIPHIVSEPNFIKQENMINTLARTTGSSVESIKAEVDRLQNILVHRKSQERKDILDKMIKQLARSDSNAELVMQDAQNSLYDLMRKYDEDNLSEDSCLAFVENQQKVEDERDDTFMGFILGDDLQIFQNMLEGDWKQDAFLLFGASPNAGKTSFLAKLAYQIAKHEEENDPCVIFLTIDDSKEQLLPKFIAIANEQQKLRINEVKHPKYYLKQGRKEVLEKRDAAYKIIKEMITKGRLIIKDVTDGNSMAYCESLIKYYANKFPTRNIVFVLDNFHKLSDLSQANSDREMFRAMSSNVKNMAVKYHCTILSTVEYVKLPTGTKPTNNSISETRKLEYDANVIIHMYNELHEYADKAENYHVSMVGGELKKMPRLEVFFSKNKIDDKKGRIFMDFYPACSDFKCVAESEVEKSKQEREDEESDDKF